MSDSIRQKGSAAQLVQGKSPKLTVENQVLLALKYWREYRTTFHLPTNWGISESSVLRIITEVENILTDSEDFDLLGMNLIAGLYNDALNH